MDFSGSRFARLSEAVTKVLTQGDFSRGLDYILVTPHVRVQFLEQLTSVLMIGESFFFRNEHHFIALRQQVIPQIIQDNSDRREIRLWSAGCSTGEEPYSLAILLEQILGSQSSTWSTSVLGTDINPAFLKRARQAEYRKWSFRRTEIHQDPHYFTEKGKNFCLRSEVRDSVRFNHLNLVKDVYPSALTGTVGLDLILFRNVAIYLHAEVVTQILQRFLRCLRPGGWLLLGEAEVSQVSPVGFNVQRLGLAVFFQKPSLGTTKLATVEMSRPDPPAVVNFSDVEVPKLSEVVPPTNEFQIKSPEKLTLAKSTNLPVVAPEFDWERIEQCLLKEDYETAVNSFDVIQDKSLPAKLKLKLVRRLLELSQTARAQELLDACLKEQPMMIDAYLLQASLAEERGDMISAEAACRKALYLDRTCAIAHFHLALVQQQAGNVLGASKSFELIKKLAKSKDVNAIVEYGDGVCYGRLCEMVESLMDS